MRRIAALAAMSILLVTAACSSSGNNLGSGSTSKTTVVSELAKWLQSLTPPMRSFVSAQAEYVAAQQSGDLKVIKLAATRVADSAHALAAAMQQAAANAPGESTGDIQGTVAALEQLGPVATTLAACPDP